MNVHVTVITSLSPQNSKLFNIISSDVCLLLDCNAATGGDTSEIGEEENFLKKRLIKYIKSIRMK